MRVNIDGTCECESMFQDCFKAFLQAANSKIPSADDIEDYNDPILREVFASSKNTQPADGGVEQLPQLNRNSGTTQSVRPEFKQPSAPIQQPGKKIDLLR